MKWPILSDEERIRLLNIPTNRPLDAVLDTDTFNEVDDQFALSYMMLSPDRVNMQAIYAAPFYNSLSSGPEDGMVRSYGEICRLLSFMKFKTEGFAFEGSRSYLPDKDTPVDSPAVRDLIKKAMARKDGDPLYVVAIGCITNIASALLMEPELVKKIVVVWLGGHAFSWKDTREFNLYQDVPASQIIFESGVPLILVPCMGVASHMIASIWELDACIGGRNQLSDALCNTVRATRSNHVGYSRVIWDVSAAACLVCPDKMRTALVHAPVLNNNCHYSFRNDTHLIRVVEELDRNGIFADLFEKLAAYKD